MNDEHQLSRRHFLTITSAIAATASLSGCAAYSPNPLKNKKKFQSDAPFVSLRDYLEVMEDNGMLLRFSGVDQDAYECTAIMYRLQDLYGLYGLPVVVFENIKIDGQWIKGPVLANHQSHYHQEALIWGLEPDWVEPRNSYRKGLAHMMSMLDKNDGNYPEIKPVVVEREQAPCKEIVLTGNQIDVTRFAFIKGNPGDAGRYINTGSIFTADPEWGQNFGTYRCQITGPQTIVVNSEPNQTGHRMLKRAMARGEKKADLAIVIGQDPVTWLVSGSRVPVGRKKPIDELAIAGGMRGKALDVVKCDLSDLTIPAECEMVIEGEIDLTQMAAEGPYHETYGYMGDENDARFLFNVKRITHRKNPILQNSFTSIGGGFIKAPMDAYTMRFWQSKYPQITSIYYHDDTKGINYVSIKKDRPGLGMEIAKAISARSFIAKLVVVVDDDLDTMNQSEMLLALGSRWQPYPASDIIEKSRSSFFEPSSPDGKTTSRIAIDATMQWPEEGGPKEFPALNKNLFEEAAPDAVERVTQKWADLLSNKIF